MLISRRTNLELQGPLVREKRPMSVLMQEYAQADPAYIAKTAVCRPYGHCGYANKRSLWRRHILPIGVSKEMANAAGVVCHTILKPERTLILITGAVFGYFETLLAAGDIQMIIQEITRIRSFDDTMRMAGIDYDMVADLFDYTWELLEKIRSTVESHSQDDSMLMETFNDEGQSNSIIYHFKARNPMLSTAYAHSE